MPESDRPETAVEIDAALDRLTTAVDRVLAEGSIYRDGDQGEVHDLLRNRVSLREEIEQAEAVWLEQSDELESLHDDAS